MSRRDTIIVAVLLNISLLAVLFIMSANPEDEGLIHHQDIQKTLVEAASNHQPEKNIVAITPINTTVKSSDEVDIVLKDFAETIKSNSVKELACLYPTSKQEEETTYKNFISSESYSRNEPTIDKVDYVEITVKSGDILGRIAQNNNTTVSAIKRLNNLNSDNLRVGQILKVPMGVKFSSSIVKAKKENYIDESILRFYTVQEKDNPWKIAKKFNVSVQELLLLNDLDELKARNLKPGDRIRVQ